MSASRAFLNPARKRQNLEILTHAHVTQIIFNKQKAIGILAWSAKARKQKKQFMQIKK